MKKKSSLLPPEAVLTHEEAKKEYRNKFFSKNKSGAEQYGGDHYINMSVQPWKAMESWMSQEAFAGFLRGNVIKYIARTDKKGGLEDLKKARHYLEKLIELQEHGRD